MNYDIFQQIKRSIDIVKAAEYYGIKFKGKMAFCPFHNDQRTPNVSFRNGRYKCFSCNASGDVIDLVSNLYHISSIEAAAKLNDDFRLGFDLKKAPDKEQIQAFQRDNKLISLWDKWEKQAYWIVATYNRENERIIDIYSSITADEEWNDIFSAALEQRQPLNRMIDTFMFGSFDEKVELFKTHREVIETYGTRI